LLDVPQPHLAIEPAGEDSAEADEIQRIVAGLGAVQNTAVVATAMAEIRADGQKPGKGLVVAASPELPEVVQRGAGLDAVAAGTLLLPASRGVPAATEAALVGDGGGEIRLATQVHDRGDSAAFVHVDDFRAVAGDGDRQVWIRFAPGADLEAASDQVKESLRGHSVSYFGASQNVIELGGYMRLVVTLALGLFAAGIVIALVGIANTVRISAIERRQEMGLQRALGAHASTVRGSLVTEAGLLVLVGSLTGLVCGAGIALIGMYALAQNQDGIGFAASAPTGFLAAAFVAAVASGALVAALATRRAVRVPPVTAIVAT
jgi:putative ABC transport system permease protein